MTGKRPQSVHKSELQLLSLRHNADGQEGACISGFRKVRLFSKSETAAPWSAATEAVTPFCAGSRPSVIQKLTAPKASQPKDSQQAGPDISALNKQLQQQWDHAANLPLGNIVIKKFSNKSACWTCDQCPDGHPHKWQSTIANRSLGARCPQCSGRKLCKHNSLATVAPAAAVFWDQEKNGCTADMVLATSQQPAHWHCSACQHEWITLPHTKTMNNSGCPQCNQGGPGRTRKRHPTFAQCQHSLLEEEWDHARNAAHGLFPTNVTLASRKKVHWSCHCCPMGHPHLWTAAPASRVGLSTGCPFCAGKAVCKCNSLQTLFPSIAADWHHELNHKTPSDYTAMSHCLVWWQSEGRGSWQQTINARVGTISQTAACRQYLQANP